MLKYKLVQRSDPRDSSIPKRWYASPNVNGHKTIYEISEDIAASSSLSRGDVLNVLMSLLDRIPDYLLAGHSVDLGEICSARITFTSDGVASEADFHHSMINHVKMAFKTGLRFKAILGKARFRRV